MIENYKKILAFKNHRAGDIILGVPSFEALRQLYPEAKLYININKDYSDIAPIFFNHPNIDGIFISDGLENFPTEIDKKNFNEMGFDAIFNPMRSRQVVQKGVLKNNETIKGYWERTWPFFFHQTVDNCYIYDLPLCDKKIYLNKWFKTNKFEKTIAFHATPGNYDKNNKKSFTKQKSQELVNEIIKLGYKILQVGAIQDEKLENTIKLDTNFFDSIKNILGCDLFLGMDSGLMWAMSGYDFKSIGCYSNEYYMIGNKNCVSSIQPINPNSLYLDNTNVNDIENELIIDNIKKML